ncbi:MAG: response regulator transcription factor [Bacteroidetes bacterium]|nr:MAG: response regulator transcription factor [Bacteroidota bacterium]
MRKETIKVAVADDHTLFREGLKLIVNSCDGLELIFEAENGQVLLEGITKITKLPDVVLLDLRMPIKDGIETTKELRQQYPDIKILVLTMIDQDDYIIHLLDMGASGYLLKNSSADEVQKAIFSVMESGFYFNDHVSKVMLNGLKRKRTLPPMLDAMTKISAREIEVCELMAEGFTTQEIADKLFISARTVETHRKHLMEKLDAKNTAGIIYRALKEGLLQ